MRIKREGLARECIAEALIKLLENEEFKNLTISQICTKAGVTRTSFYRSYSSKKDILAKEVRAVTDSFLETTQISFKKDDAEEYFAKLFSHFQKQKRLCKALAKAGLLYLIKDEFDRLFLKAYRNEYDQYKSVFLSGGVYNVLHYWYLTGCRENPQVISERLKDLLKI